MRLRDLLPELNLTKIPNLEIRGISCDSRVVSKDYLYVAIKGSKFDGHNFISEAIRKGAEAIITQKPETIRLRQGFGGCPPKFQTKAGSNQKPGIPIFTVKDTRKAIALLAQKFYGNPHLKLKFIGITGTNGKTTISYLIESILRRKKFDVGVIGTINYRLNGKSKIYPFNTTPAPLQLYPLLLKMTKKNIDYTIMEVSSHALDQERVYGIKFDYAVYTNLSQDHLDYHKNLGDYFLAKAKLFEGLSSKSCAIINSDDRFSVRLKRKTKAKIYTYGISHPSDIRAENIVWDLEGVRFNVRGERFDFPIKSKLIGYYNVYNILAAITTAISMGIEFKIIKDGIEDLRYIPGRLERIDSKKRFKIFVDYAHTPEAIRNVLLTLKNFNSTVVHRGEVKRNLICVFGCGGERDRGKRPKMGRIVSLISDHFIISNDNPRNEDPNRIVSDILKGIKTKNFEVILDREKAIRKAISLAKEDDIVIVLGKGHEKYQIIRDKRIRFCDREVIRECLMSRQFMEVCRRRTR